MTRNSLARVTLLGLLAGAGCGSSQQPSQDPPTWGVPISGGNMIVGAGGSHAFVADADRDRILDVDLTAGTSTVIALNPSDEPGRLVEDAAGRVHVALRRGGALVTIQNDQIVARRAVCAEPRGVAYEAATDLVHVACSTGELVSLPAAGGDATRSVVVDRDLRDVLVRNGSLYVTRFRSAELLQLDVNGAVVARVAPPTVQRFNFEGGGDSTGVEPTDGGATVDAVAAVAWRTVALPDGRFIMSHQRQLDVVLSTVVHGGYGTGCGGPVEPDLAIVDSANNVTPMNPITGDALPVDLAVSPDGSQLAIAFAGGQQVAVVPLGSLTPDTSGNGSGSDNGSTGNGAPSVVCPGGVDNGGQPLVDNLGAPTSVAYTPSNQVLVYYPELPGIAVHGTDGSTQVITLPGDVGYDAGRGMFHEQTPSGLACASCHPEARDDGLVWQFDTEGPRRTQNLSGSILDRAPYHWTGDEADLPTLMDDVFGNRMGGAPPSNSEHKSLGPWLNRVLAPAPLAGVAADSAARGQALFQSPDVGCTTCHTGALMSTKAIVDVGTGGMFKVPSLVGVNARAPYMHDGCAATLLDRFGPCGGGDLHGKTSQLTPAQLSDLVSYLETL